VSKPNTSPPEHTEQVWLINEARFRWPDLRIVAIPNAARRTRYERTKLLAEGMSAGVPDLFIPALNLWIELKRTQGSSTSQVQKEWLAYLNQVGHKAVIAKGHEQALAYIEEALKDRQAGG
jgi:hypothetical protein